MEDSVLHRDACNKNEEKYKASFFDNLPEAQNQSYSFSHFVDRSAQRVVQSDLGKKCRKVMNPFLLHESALLIQA